MELLETRTRKQFAYDNEQFEWYLIHDSLMVIFEVPFKAFAKVKELLFLKHRQFCVTMLRDIPEEPEQMNICVKETIIRSCLNQSLSHT